MTEQLMLSSFAQETISTGEFAKDFRPWNNLVFEWNVEYSGYARGDENPEGYVAYHVIFELTEALVLVRKPKTYKKIEKPGYRLTVTQNIKFEGRAWESFFVHEESFPKEHLRKAVDVFQHEILDVQTWIEIAESRARIIPQANDVFECFHCGWVTDIQADDITCPGCGKRYWSDKMWGLKADNQGNSLCAP